MSKFGDLVKGKKEAPAPAAPTPAARLSWWERGYDELDRGDIREFAFEIGTTPKRKPVSVKKDAGLLLYKYLKSDLPRALGAIQASPGEHTAEVLEQINLTPKAAVALVSKPAEERHRWIEDLDARHPDLSRVLRRSIGLSSTDRSPRAREVLVHYALTLNPDPCKKNEMAKARNSAAVRHK